MEEIGYDSAFIYKYSECEGIHALKKNARRRTRGSQRRRSAADHQAAGGHFAGAKQNWVEQTGEVLAEGPSKRPAADGMSRYYGRTAQGQAVIFTEAISADEVFIVEIADTTSRMLSGKVAHP
jgi:tRNA-2-methylthio-N6-dimethylallyladenosine synthase